MGGYSGRGQLWIQTTSWWSTADYVRMNHHGVWLSIAIEEDELFFRANGTAWVRILGWSHSCVTDLPQSTSLSNHEGHNSGSSSLLFRQLQCRTAGPWEGWWWWVRFNITAALGLGKPGSYLALHVRAALLGGHLFCRLFFFLYGYYQNLIRLLSFLLVAFAVDCL